ncbi:hypothetical protein EXS73_02765 [Candidatus Pacearchaeota archaeon]|nr:hypothetical protein [Candidatus Pacearchaeota archaeon]
MNELDQRVIETKKKWVQKNLRQRLKEEERRCAESARIVLNLGNRMLLRKMLKPLFMSGQLHLSLTKYTLKKELEDI